MEVFDIWPAALWVLAAALGLIAGSFLNVVVYRLPIMMERDWRAQCADLAEQPSAIPDRVGADQPFDLSRPRSACPSCGEPVAARHNVPIVSFLLLGGRCARCGARIPTRYPAIEAAAAALAVIVALRFGASWETVIALPFTWALLALAVIDIDHKLLPDSMTQPLLWAGLLISLPEQPLFADLPASVGGAAAGYLTLWSVYQLFKLLTGKEGMGYGDFKLLAALGAWLGWQLLPLVILLAAATGTLLAGLALATGRHSRDVPIPFGPYLAAAGWLALLWGPELLALYAQLLY